MRNTARDSRGRQGREAAPERGARGGGVGRRTVAASAVAAAALLATGGADGARADAAGRGARRAPAVGGLVLRLPAPTGPHPVGSVALHLVDRSRRDPWEDGISVRELMVTVCYPARTVHGRPRAPQLTADAAPWFARVDTAVHPELPRSGVDWAATLTHAHPGTPAQTVRRPVLLYSPGGGDPRTVGTGVAEELASHGYVVVTVDHPGDASEVDFPSGTAERDKVRPTVFRGDPRSDPRQFRTAIDTRITDLRFVIDQLGLLAAGRNPDADSRTLPTGLGRALDLRRVGGYGHSAGGTAVAEALYEDRRIGAAVNLEGFLDHPPQAPGEEGELFPVARHGVDRPLLLLGSERFAGRAQLARSWSAMLSRPGGRTERGLIGNAAHWVFTDYAAVAPQLQAAGLMSAARRTALVGALPPRESVPAVRRHVRTFFDRHLPPC
ncbi:alpha/beta hydrolase [Streptomyces sp. NPDC048644]|uniref:alpha/beta hydrolase n=1 Tax=Streptomyces sp. NPDC048644 TaxID=3365582 RepID=UPI00371DAB71